MASPQEEMRLPRSLPEFRALVRAAKRKSRREALRQRIESEESGVGAALTEARLLELVREPRISREFGWDLAVSHGEAWIWLLERRSRRFAAMLRRWMAGRDTKLAGESARHLAWMALDDDVPRLRGGLRGGPWPMRQAIALGLESAGEDRRGSATFRRAMFDELGAWAMGEREAPPGAGAHKTIRTMINAMAALDRRRAFETFKSKRVLHPKNAAARSAVGFLSFMLEHEPERFGRPVDPALLWVLFDETDRRGARPRPARRSHQEKDELRLWAQADLLHLAADRDPLRTRRATGRLLKGAPAPLKKSLRRALNRCRDAPDPGAALRAFYRQPSRFGTSAVLVLRAHELREHVLSDGLPLYFSNLGEHWRQAAAGLRLVGSPRAAAILQRAAAAVMEYGSLRDNPSALEATIKMDEAADRRLEKLHEEFSKVEEGLGQAIESYVGGRGQEFGGRGK